MHSTEDDGREAPTRQRLLGAAHSIVARDGVAALTIGAVAAEAGTYRAAVHYHFGTKSHLMAALVQRQYESAAEEAAAAARDSPPGEARVHYILERWLDHISRDDDLMFFDTLGYVLRSQEPLEQLRGLYDHWTDLLEDLLSEGPVCRQVELRSVALVLRMLIDGATIDRLIDPESEDWRVAAVAAEEMINRALAGETAEL